MQMFMFLEGISPWWWVAFGVALGAVEMATMSFFLIWPAIAALVIAVVLLAVPDLSGEAQIALFAILAVALTFAGRSLLHRAEARAPAPDSLNNRAALMIGRHAVVEAFTGPEGAVSIDGVRWQAQWPVGTKAKIGATVKISAATGMTLMVEAGT